MTGEDFYQGWAQFRATDKSRKRIGAVGLTQAKVVWHKWLMHCANSEIHWDTATAVDVQAFVCAIKPRTTRGDGEPSPVTLRRYWRILFDLYAYARLKGFVATNPADFQDRPASEKTESLALESHHWKLLNDKLPGGFSPKERRDKLILLLFMSCALTVSELRGLDVADVVETDVPWETVAADDTYRGLALFQHESPHWQTREAHPRYAIEIDSDKPGRARSILLSKRTSKAMFDWLQCRSVMSKKCDCLFVGNGGITPITAKSVYNVCHGHIKETLKEEFSEGTGIEHLGPNTLRNTCILAWHSSGVREDDIMRKLGLQAPGALRRMQKRFRPMVVVT